MVTWSENVVDKVVCHSGHCLVVIQIVVSDFSEVANDLDWIIVRFDSKVVAFI